MAKILPFGPLHILLIEDDTIDAKRFLKCCASAARQTKVHHVTLVEEGLRWLDTHNVDIIVLDMHLPDGGGTELVRQVARVVPMVPVVIFTGEEDDAVALEALQMGAQDYIRKSEMTSLNVLRQLQFAIERHNVAWRLSTVAAKLRESNEELKAISTTDPLTRLLNRRGLTTLLDKERRNRNHSVECGVAFLMDIDDFKHFNDNFGHHVGDRVLESVAQVLQKALRGGDAIARIGGDEFLALLPQTTIAEGQGVAERVCNQIEALRIETDKEERVCVTVSIGLAELSDMSTPIETLLALTHDALADSKELGKNRVSIG